MNLFKQFWYSLYSPKTISKFRLQKIGKTIFYLFLLAILYTLPGFFSFEKGIKLQVNNVSDLLTENIKSISLKEGTLEVNDNKPFERKIGEFTYAIYPNEENIPSSLIDENNAIIILKNRMIIKTNGAEQDYPYPTLNTTEINEKDVSNLINNVKQALPVFLIALFFLFYLGSCFFIFIIATLLAFVTARTKSGKALSFRQRFAMIAYSLTLPTVIYLLLGLVNINLPFQTIIFILLTALMYSLSIKQLPSRG